MKRTVGLWIDHKRAVIVFVNGKEEEITSINSSDEKQHRQSSVSVSADDTRQRDLSEHLKSYYGEVISRIRDAESILIFGPGEAKGELKKLLEKDNLSGRLASVETADKMTDPQIAAKVKDYFLHQSSTAAPG